MAKLERVLVAIGQNDRNNVEEFIDIVEAIAGPAGASVIILHVFPRPEYEELLEQIEGESPAGGLEPDSLARRHSDIQTPAKQLENAGIDAEIRGSVGDPETEIVQIAGDVDADLLFIGGAGRSPADKAIFGDAAQQILLKAPCPVTYIRRE